MEKKKNTMSDFMEDCIWMSYRYCIGRHSIAAVHHAEDIVSFLKDADLNDDRRKFYADDIRREIADRLSWNSVGFTMDYSVPANERKPLEAFINCLITNGITEKDLMGIEKISYYFDYGEKKLKYSIAKTDNIAQRAFVSLMDINDLLVWANLASWLDKGSWKTVVVKKDDGEEIEVKCFESYLYGRRIENDTESKEPELRYEKILRPVEEFENRPWATVYIPKENIVEVK